MRRIRFVSNEKKKFIKQIHTFTSNILFGQRFGLGCPFVIFLPFDLIKAGATQTETSSRSSNNMLLVNVWICLMIMISQQEPSLKKSCFLLEGSPVYLGLCLVA